MFVEIVFTSRQQSNKSNALTNNGLWLSQTWPSFLLAPNITVWRCYCLSTYSTYLSVYLHARIERDMSLPQYKAELLLNLASYPCVFGEWFDGRPEGRGVIYLVGYFQNLAYSGWFLQSAYPSFKRGYSACWCDAIGMTCFLILVYLLRPHILLCSISIIYFTGVGLRHCISQCAASMEICCWNIGWERDTVCHLSPQTDW